ncbi:hypothetical protein AAGS40_23200 [Paraburkholderia sp. PREW-6R]|uniref:hypothetical protein n=1 Tax=Paraburkholderia sp. PREW-6R TaxID=3141544 RepID=UPI0031F54C88
MGTSFKSKVEITASETVSATCERVAARLGDMARKVHDKTKFVMNDMASTVGAKMQEIASHTKGLWGQSGVVGALGAALAAGGTAEVMGSLAEKAENLHRTAIGLGMSTRDLQLWSYAAEQAGVDAEMMTKGVAKMNETVFEVAHGGAKAQAELFKQMGVSVRDAKGNTRGITDVAMDVASRFKEHVDRIAKLRAGGNKALADSLETEENNAAQKLFGMKAREVAALLVQGKDGIRRAFAQADGTGGVMSEEQIEKLQRYERAMKKVEFAKQGLMVTLFADKMELLGTKIAKLADNIGAFRAAHPQIFQFASALLVAVSGLVAMAAAARLAQLGFAFLAGGKLVAQIGQVGVTAAVSGRMMEILSVGVTRVSGAMRLLMVASPWLLAIGAAAALVYYNWDKIEPVVMKVWNSMVGLYNAVEPLLAAFGSGVWQVCRDTFSEVWGIAKELWNTFAGMFPSISGLGDLFGQTSDHMSLLAGLSNGLRIALDSIKVGVTLMTVPFRYLAGWLETIFDTISRVVGAFRSDGFMGGIKALFDSKAAGDDLGKRMGQNFKGVGDKLMDPLKDIFDPSKMVTADDMRRKGDVARDNARVLERPAAKTMSERPQEVKLSGPVQVDTKGKLGIDVRISADQGLKVNQTGVDRTGAPRIVGDTGVSMVTP